MKKNVTKAILKTFAVLGLVGGLVHVAQPLGWNPLTLFNNFGGYSEWVQFVAGVSILVTIWLAMNKKR